MYIYNIWDECNDDFQDKSIMYMFYANILFNYMLTLNTDNFSYTLRNSPYR